MCRRWSAAMRRSFSTGSRPCCSIESDLGLLHTVARWAERGARTIYPEFFAIHPIEAEAPEEDVLLLTNRALVATLAFATDPKAECRDQDGGSRAELFL